jgi:hypothetical protein
MNCLIFNDYLLKQILHILPHLQLPAGKMNPALSGAGFLRYGTR